MKTLVIDLFKEERKGTVISLWSTGVKQTGKLQIYKICQKQTGHSTKGHCSYKIYKGLDAQIGHEEMVHLRPLLSNQMLTPHQMHQQSILKREQYKSKKLNNEVVVQL